VPMICSDVSSLRNASCDRRYMSCSAWSGDAPSRSLPSLSKKRGFLASACLLAVACSESPCTILSTPATSFHVSWSPLFDILATSRLTWSWRPGAVRTRLLLEVRPVLPDELGLPSSDPPPPPSVPDPEVEGRYPTNFIQAGSSSSSPSGTLLYELDLTPDLLKGDAITFSFR